MKKILNYQHLKWIVIIGVAVVSIFGFIWLISQPVTTIPSHAIQPKLNLTLSPVKGTFLINQPQVITILLQPADSGKTISSFNLSIVPGSFDSTDIGVPASFPDGNTSMFTLIKKGGKQLIYVVTAPSSQLPTAITIPVTIQSKTEMTGNLNVRVLGATGSNIVGNIYNIASTRVRGTYKFSKTTPTRPPTPTP